MRNKETTEMNEKEQAAAAFGGKSGEQPVVTTDSERRIAELERELQNARVEQGRVKKLSEELKARDEELAKLRASRQNEDILSALSAEERESVSPEVLGVLTKAVGKVQSDYERRFREQEALRSQAEAGRREADTEAFARAVDARFPGFFSSVGQGGANEAAWKTFMRFNGPSVNTAYANCDMESIAHFVESFYRNHLGTDVPSGKGGSAAPEPSNQGGGNRPELGGGNRVYTNEEYAALDERCMKLRREGKIQEYRKLRDELDTILSEGRVKD